MKTYTIKDATVNATTKHHAIIVLQNSWKNAGSKYDLVKISDVKLANYRPTNRPLVF